MVGAKRTGDQTKFAETWMKFAQERTTTVPVKKTRHPSEEPWGTQCNHSWPRQDPNPPSLAFLRHPRERSLRAQSRSRTHQGSQSQHAARHFLPRAPRTRRPALGCESARRGTGRGGWLRGAAPGAQPGGEVTAQPLTSSGPGHLERGGTGQQQPER